jgi:hypothetical protein
LTKLLFARARWTAICRIEIVDVTDVEPRLVRSAAPEIEAHLATLRQTPRVIDSVAERLTEQQLRLRIPSGAWSRVEVLAHLHACAVIWGDDIERMLAQDSPRFTKPHPRREMQSGRYLEPTFADSAHAYAVLRGRLIEILEPFGPEQWDRGATINGRGHTVYTHVRRLALHETAHAEQIRETCRVISELEPGH